MRYESCILDEDFGILMPCKRFMEAVFLLDGHFQIWIVEVKVI